MGRKFGGLRFLLWGGGAGSPSNTKSPGPRPASIPSGILIYAAIWPQRILAENWGAVPLWGGGAGSPSNIMWPGPRPTCTPSFILIRQTVWPQYTNVTDRQTDRTGQDRTDKQRSDNIGQTVLQTVAQKSWWQGLMPCRVLTSVSKSFLAIFPPLTCSNCRLPDASDTLNNDDNIYFI